MVGKKRTKCSFGHITYALRYRKYKTTDFCIRGWGYCPQCDIEGNHPPFYKRADQNDNNIIYPIDEILKLPIDCLIKKNKK